METFLGIMIPFLGTALGAACVFFMKRSLGDLVQRALAGFAAGVMVAASIDVYKRQADELLRRLQASQFVAEHGDQVCPAKWQPGAETLKPSLDLVGMP